MPIKLAAFDPTGQDQRLAAQCGELVRQLGDEFKNRDAYYQQVDDVLYGRTPVTIPAGYKKIGKVRRNPLASYYVNTISAALTVDEPRVQFPHAGFGEKALTNSTLREHFFDASWRRQQEDAKANLFRRFVRPLVSKGEAVFKTVERTKTAWAAYGGYARGLAERLAGGDLAKLDGDSKDRLFNAQTEEYKRERAPYPIRSIDVPPETYRYWVGEDGVTLALEHKRVPYLETLVRYGMGLSREAKVVPQALGQALPAGEWRSVMNGTSALTMDEIWTWDRCVLLVGGPGAADDAGGTIIKQFRHAYGDPYTKTLRGPYFHCLGITTESRLPEYAGLGMLHGFLDLFVMLDELLSYQQINATITALAAYKRTQAPGALNDPQIGEDGLPKAPEPEIVEPGKIFPYDISPIEQPRGGQALNESIAQTREFLELILPRVLQGVVDTTDSGYQLAQAVRLGKIAFQPLIDNMRLCFAERVGFESRLIEECVGEKVYAWGEPAKPGKRSAAAGMLGIGPDDLNGVHTYRVLLSPDATNEQLIDVRKHAEMVKTGFEDITDAQEALGQNPEEVERKRLLTETKNDPEIRNILKQRIKRRISLHEQQAQQAGDQAAGMPAPGAPAAPGAALGGAGQVFEPAQTMPIEPGVPGQQIGIPSVPAGAPGGPPPGSQMPPPPGMALVA